MAALDRGTRHVNDLGSARAEALEDLLHAAVRSSNRRHHTSSSAATEGQVISDFESSATDELGNPLRGAPVPEFDRYVSTATTPSLERGRHERGPTRRNESVCSATESDWTFCVRSYRQARNPKVRSLLLHSSRIGDHEA